ncbi:hypothetical protein HYU94_01185 [Candidatus Daviesbacteria bacterium]|nr:hypothetical protein [Candidatus Daviesbacteria bacterium]
MKKFLILLLTAYSLQLTAPAMVFAQAATLSLEPSSGTFNQGCNFSLKVNLNTGGAETDGTDAILLYDNTRFNAISITNGPIYPDFPGNNIDSQAGKITISGLASVNTPFSSQGALATINFAVLNSAPQGATQVTFDFDPTNKAKTTDSNVVQRVTIADVLNSVTNGNYTVGTGVCKSGGSPLVTATPSATPKTIDCAVDKTCQGPGTPQLTFTIAIVGGILTVLGILGLALL